jgi:hypothetical protein
MRVRVSRGLRFRALAFALAFAMVPAQFVTAAGAAPADWTRVMLLRPGRFVSVQPFEGKGVTGELVSVTENEIVVRAKKDKDVSFPQGDVRVVKVTPRLLAPAAYVAFGGALVQLAFNLWALSKRRSGEYVEPGMWPSVVALGGAIVAFTQLPRKVYEAQPAAARR